MSLESFIIDVVIWVNWQTQECLGVIDESITSDVIWICKFRDVVSIRRQVGDNCGMKYDCSRHDVGKVYINEYATGGIKHIEKIHTKHNQVTYRSDFGRDRFPTPITREELEDLCK